MIMRAGSLGIVSERQKESLLITLGRKGWRREEPYDLDFKPEIPLFFSRACEMIVKESILSKSELLIELEKDQNDVESLLGLENFFVETHPHEVDEPRPILKFKESLPPSS
jgi:hypothetical protein